MIKKPIDLTKINNRLSAGAYESFDALCQDFHVMFDNACTYNEPESGIYKVRPADHLADGDCK